MNSLLEQTRAYLLGLDIQWAFCGGFALDLFLNTEIRKHSDIDICVFEEDRSKIVDYMLSNGWNVWQFLGQGRVRILNSGDKSDPGRNLMCVKEDCELVKFYPTSEKGIFLHEFFHTGIERLNYLEFLFNQKQEDHFIFNPALGLTREMSKAILYHDDYPYLAPELALLYKSSGAAVPDYRLDYDMTVSRLNNEQDGWLQDGLQKLCPQGHPWIRE